MSATLPSPSIASIQSIKDECQSYGKFEPEYFQKMMHQVPSFDVVDRADFLLKMCKDQTILSVGCTGPMQEVIDGVAGKCYGIDIEPCDRPDGTFARLDLDCVPYRLPFNDIGFDLIVLGEVLEHLINPGYLLRSIPLGVPTVITVPNAFCDVGRKHMEAGFENVNRDHVLYYSFKTLTTLLERCGYQILERHWYGGRARFAEGLVFVAHRKA